MADAVGGNRKIIQERASTLQSVSPLMQEGLLESDFFVVVVSTDHYDSATRKCSGAAIVLTLSQEGFCGGTKDT